MMSTESRHMSFAPIVDLVEGRLSAADQAQTQAHAAACARCAADILRLTRVVELMRDDIGEDAPVPLIQRAVGLYQLRRAPAPALRQRLPAALRFDSRQTLPLGLRGGATSERQLLFNADGFDVDVRISSAGDVWTVAGQVLGPDQAGVVALHGASATLQGALTELSEFKLSPVLPGTYTLIVQLLSVEIEISGLAVGM
jgi:anti-sigma factor RsiW